MSEGIVIKRTDSGWMVELDLGKRIVRVRTLTEEAAYKVAAALEDGTYQAPAKSGRSRI